MNEENGRFPLKVSGGWSICGKKVCAGLKCVLEKKSVCIGEKVCVHVTLCAGKEEGVL